jgi:HEAT repeat protein
MSSSDRSDPRAEYRAAVARQLAEQDLRRAVPAVLGAPRDDSARFDLAEALKLLGSAERLTRWARAGY